MNTIDFVIESNKIEGIFRKPTEEEIEEHDRFVGLQFVSVWDLERFVSVYQPGAVIRDSKGLDVIVGNYIPPKGTPNMSRLVQSILDNSEYKTPHEVHVEYETLHPFTDGNGRSGRALWAWHMMKTVGNYKLGFLHTFYYQTLKESRKRSWV
jgi:hypothetical protein